MYEKILYPIRFEAISPDMLSSLDALSCVLNFKKAGQIVHRRPYGILKP